MEVTKSLMTKKRTSKFRQVYVKLIAVCKQNVSKPVTLNKLKFSSLPYNKLVSWSVWELNNALELVNSGTSNFHILVCGDMITVEQCVTIRFSVLLVVASHNES